jgi:hypothetical protein
LILGGSDSEAALEVAVQVALVGEAAGGGGLGDRLAGFEQAAGGADPVRELQRMGRQTGVLAEEADEAELADPGGGGELVEADVAFGLVGEEVPGQAQRLVAAGAKRRSSWAGVWGAVDQGAQPLGESSVTLEPGGGRLQGGAQCQEVTGEPGSEITGSGKATSARTLTSPSPAIWARPATSTTMSRAVHGRASRAAPACALDGSQATSCPGSTRRRSRPRRERIGCPVTTPKTYSPRGSMA